MTVVSVEADGDDAVWTFSEAPNVGDFDALGALQVEDSANPGTFIGPNSSSPESAVAVRSNYASPPAPGDAWLVLSQPVTMATPLTVPVTGVIV